MQKKMVLAALLVLAGGLLLVKGSFTWIFQCSRSCWPSCFIAGGRVPEWFGGGRTPSGWAGVHSQQQAGDALRMSYAFCDSELDLTSQSAPALMISVCFGRLVVRYDPACPPAVQAPVRALARPACPAGGRCTSARPASRPAGSGDAGAHRLRLWQPRVRAPGGSEMNSGLIIVGQVLTLFSCWRWGCS